MPKTDFDYFIPELLDFIRRPAWDDGEFNRLALRLFRLQFEHVPVYRRLCERRGLAPECVRQWSEIPAIPTAAFKEAELTSLEPSERHAVFHSSGTTQQKPGRHFHSQDSLPVYEASLLPWFRQHLLSDTAAASLRFISLTPGKQRAPHSSLAHMFDTVRRACFSRTSEADAFMGETDASGLWQVDFEKTEAALKSSAAAGQPVLLMGTAFSFVHLLDHFAAAAGAFPLPPGSRVLETGGYKGRSRILPKAELHRHLSKCFALPPAHLAVEYGMSELSSQAYDAQIPGPADPASRAFRFPPWARAQILSPETGREAKPGEPGLIRVFDLANVRSVLAVQTEDLGLSLDGGFQLLGRAAQAEPRGCSLQAA